MTATISRLYDNYADAKKAVQNLEAAGAPHSDISIMANNSDNCLGADKKDRDHDGVDDRAEGAGKGAGIGAGVGGRRWSTRWPWFACNTRTRARCCRWMACFDGSGCGGRRCNWRRCWGADRGWDFRRRRALVCRRCPARRYARLGTCS